jgi:trimeric autotransporter adhesin
MQSLGQTVRLAATIAIASMSIAQLRAQCEPNWYSTGGTIGTNGRVLAATLWDPDGVGPQPEHLVIAGEFGLVTDTFAPLVAMLDPTTGQWQPVGSGLSGTRVNQLTVLATGELLASGVLTSAGGVPVDGLARWDGQSWTPLGDGTRKEAFLKLPNGDLLAANNTTPSGPWVGKLDVWNGTTWSQFAPDVDGRIAAMVQMPNGDIVVAGSFLSAGGVPSNNIARWNGATWAPLGGGSDGYLGGTVSALAVLPNGDLVAGGYFTQAGGQPANRIARWDGSAWHAFGSGVAAPSFPGIASLNVLSNGDLIAGGYFNSIDGVPANCIARLRNGIWSAVGGGANNIVDTVVEMPSGDLVVGGAFAIISTGPANHLARWDGSTWSSFGTPPLCDDQVLCSTVAANGDLVIAGEFTEVSGGPAMHIARRTASGWTALGSGIAGPVRAVAALPNGDVVAGGFFADAGGVPAANIARWDGAAWSPLGLGVNGSVLSMFVMPNGDLVVGGVFTSAGGQPAQNLARWNGSNWSAMASGPTGPVNAIGLRDNGNLIVAVTASLYFSNLEQWDGTSWSQFTDVTAQSITSIQKLPNGDMVFGASAFSVGGVTSRGAVRWDGSNWFDMQLGSNSFVRTFALLPNGELVAAGNLVFGANGADIARWDGTSWSALNDGNSYQIVTLATLPDGEVVAGGSFTTIDQVVSPYLASLITPCPATAASYGAGCIGSNGLNELTATALPWLGSTFRSRASGIQQLSFVAMISGFTSLAVPLPALFPEAGVGCIGYSSAEAITLEFPTAGKVASQIALPLHPALVGAVFHQYALAFEFDSLGALVDVTSSNGLMMTLGQF